MTSAQIKDTLIDYVMSFYGPGGLYPMNANATVVHSATADCMQIAEIKGEEFCFDSIDREQVRDHTQLLLNTTCKFPTK
jgi:hypothetical protein